MEAEAAAAKLQAVARGRSGRAVASSAREAAAAASAAAPPEEAAQAEAAEEAEAEAEEAVEEWDDEQEAERLAARRARKEKELAMLADSVGSGDLGLNLGSKMLKRVAGAASVQPQALE